MNLKYLIKAGVRKYILNKKSTFTNSAFRNLRSFQIEGSEREWKQLLFYNEMLEKIENVPGNVAEFGVAGGISLISFIRILRVRERGLDSKEIRKVYGFDSFEGLPKLGREDRSKVSSNADMKEGGFHDPMAYENLFEFAKKDGETFVVRGWFSETLPTFLRNNPHEAFALVHMDCDLYESTKFVLEKIWGNVVPGGIIVFDELYHKDFPGETAAFNEVMKGKKFKLMKSKIKPDKKYVIKDEV